MTPEDIEKVRPLDLDELEANLRRWSGHIPTARLEGAVRALVSELREARKERDEARAEKVDLLKKLGAMQAVGQELLANHFSGECHWRDCSGVKGVQFSKVDPKNCTCGVAVRRVRYEEALS